MARTKKTSKVIESARTRQAGTKSIDVDFDFGNGITSAAFASKIDATEESLETYNTTLSQVDEQKDIFEMNEKDLKDFHERVLLAVAAKYGKNSIEYEKAGGTRKSERRKPVRGRAESKT